jgi:methylmalonyl-CoA/ethylmalonyl-CoA epimerase
MSGDTGLAQVAQYAKDLDRAAAFYERLLGTAPLARFEPPGLLFFGLGGTRLLLEDGVGSSMIYLKVDDVPTRVEELRADGVVIEAEPHIIFSHTDDTLGPAGHDEWMAFIRDSEGNLVGLVSHAPRAES